MFGKSKKNEDFEDEEYEDEEYDDLYELFFPLWKIMLIKMSYPFFKHMML